MVDRLNQAHMLISHYQKLYEQRFGKRPILNRNKLKYLLADILRDLSMDEVKALITYYIKVEKAEPALLTLCYDYAEILEVMRKNEKDASERSQLMRETMQRTREFRERYGK